MTVKLAKFFNSAGSNTAVPPPLPPPNPIQSYYASTSTTTTTKMMTNHTTTTTYHHHYPHQQPLQQNEEQYNPYADDDDNMSMYSTSTSIMTSRDHPYNNSQRPLLPERRPQLLLNKKKLQPPVPATQQHQQQPPNYKPYISPYVQQQKRDSAKGLHGFNDFDILSQQYNQHLQSPHIGYPYGSPPSPTAQSSDFVFDDKYNNRSGGNQIAAAGGNIASAAIARYANVNSISSSNSVNQHNAQFGGSNTNYTTAYNHAQFIGKSSRFEDDFCTRRNVEFSKESSSMAGSGTGSSKNSSHGSLKSGGPFIFGVSHAEPINQQQQFEREAYEGRVLPGGRGFRDSSSGAEDSVIVAKNPLVGDNGQATMQSTSDTSSSSRDSKSKKGVKALLSRRKSKKKKSQESEKQLEIEKSKTAVKSAANEIPTIKCVVVGDGAVGKTNLILSYLENRFNSEHVPTASDIYNADVMVNDSPVHLTLCDTAGQDTLDPLRELCYPDSDVFLLCFSVAKPETFHAIKAKWAPKFAKTKAALILVGTQSDLRNNQNVLNKLKTTGEKPISYADAWDLATTIGAKYIETSSVTQDKVKEVFDTAIWEGLLPTTLPPTPSFWRKLFCLA